MIQSPFYSKQQQYKQNFQLQIQNSYRTSINKRLLSQDNYSYFNEFQTQRVQRPEVPKQAILLTQNKQLILKRLQLINDPIYKQSLRNQNTKKQKSKILRSIILKYTNLFKVIQPENKYMIIWDIIVTITIIYYAFEICLVTMFGVVAWQAELTNTWSLIFTYFNIFIWLIDIFVTLNKGIYENGILVLNRKKIYKKYFRFQFFIDIISWLIIICCLIFQNLYELNYLKYLILFKFYNFLLIDQNFRRRLIFYPFRDTVYCVAKYTLYILVSSHYYAAFFYGIDFYIYNNNYYGPNTPSLVWIYSASAQSDIVTSLSWSYQYLYSLYWSVVTITTISYGDITPLNPISAIYVVIMLLSCRILFSFIINRVVQSVITGQQNVTNFRNQTAHINLLLYKNNISVQLKQKVRSYFQNMWNQDAERDQQQQKQLINILPSTLRREILDKVYKNFYHDLLIYKYFPNQIIAQISNKITQVRTTNQQDIMINNSQVTAVYHLVSGKIVYHLNNQQVFTVAEEGSFGIYELFAQQKSILCVKSIDRAILYKLDREDFFDIINNNSVYYQIYRFILDSILIDRKGNSIFNLDCFVCNQKNHFCKQCPYIHYIAQMNDFIKRKKKNKQYLVRQKLRKKESSLKLKKNLKLIKFKIEKNMYSQDNYDDYNFDIQKYLQKLQMVIKQSKYGVGLNQFQSIFELSQDKRANFKYYKWQYNLDKILYKLYKKKR